ncbi:hypothetical protein L207DRAFT_258385 [Hyaloscypha variabilis F]|uniref:Uncharacterized protein n=1 Tax=Hyaloscypha variabilis (strain UAMH 11265 / GT02V1 / F) TaxID=1149755 RepID=A0A2J6S4F9_HYAVF|nr:hypothetical protein L207DRAFT_258385 [Hyaloscypha variabilis F]
MVMKKVKALFGRLSRKVQSSKSTTLPNSRTKSPDLVDESSQVGRIDSANPADTKNQPGNNFLAGKPSDFSKVDVPSGDQNAPPIQGSLNNDANAVPNEPQQPDDSETSKPPYTRPIAELWDEAYDELSKTNPGLIGGYENELKKALKVEQLTLSKGQRHIQMKKVVEDLTQKIKNKEWMVKFKDCQFAVKDFVEPVASVVEWAKGFIDSAVQVSPQASVAWAGVSLLLPLLLNPSKQAAERVTDLNLIASILRECSIRESIYRRQYETSHGIDSQYRSLSDHKNYKDSIGALYVSILEFQTAHVCYLSGNTVVRVARDMVVWDDWGKMKEEISEKNAELRSVDQTWKLFSIQEDREKLEKRHKENLASLKSITSEISRLSTLIKDAQTDQHRSTLLKWLRDSAKVDPSKFYGYCAKRVQPGTGNWLLEDRSFENWKSKRNSFFWFQGKAGVGKSCLSAIVIDHLKELFKTDPYTAVAYFYIRYDTEETHSPSNLLKSLILQLYARRPDTPQPLEILRQYSDSGYLTPTMKELREALHSLSQDFERTYIIIDGVDECPGLGEGGRQESRDEDPRGELFQLLGDIPNLGLENLHLLITSRPSDDIQKSLKSTLSRENAEAIDLTGSYSIKVDNDIRTFIDGELRRALFTLSPTLKAELTETLIEKSGGMFQYVALQFTEFKIEFGNMTTNKESVDKVLKRLPKGLDATYMTALGRLNEKWRPQSIRALSWVALWPMPITVKELAVAVLIEFRKDVAASSEELSEVDYSTPLFTEAETFGKPADVLTLLPGLLEIQSQTIKGDGTSLSTPGNNDVVHLTHFSLLEYLTPNKIEKKEISDFVLDKETTSLRIAEASLRYFIHIAEQKIDQHRDNFLLKFPLCEHAAIGGLRLAESLGCKRWSSLLRRLVKDLLQRPESFNKLTLLEIGGRSDCLPSEYTILHHRLNEITSFLLEDEFNVTNKKGETAVHWAARRGSNEILQLLHRRGADFNAQN